MSNRDGRNEAMPSDLENNQPETSPYTSESLILKFGEGWRRYTVPRQLFEQQFPTAAITLEKRTGNQNIKINRADKDIGHTVVHWLYTEEYQVLQNPSLQGKAKRENGYRLAVHAYCAALNYALLGLATHARRQIEMLEDAVDTGRILAIAREVFPKYEDIGVPAAYQTYLKKKMMSAVKAKEMLFHQNELIKAFGQVPEFDMFVLENVISLFSLRIAGLEWMLESASKQGLHKDKVVEEDGCSKRPTEPQGPLPHSELPQTHSVKESDYEGSPTGIESEWYCLNAPAKN